MKAYTIFYTRKPVLTVMVVVGELTYENAVDIFQTKRKELGEPPLKYIRDITFQRLEKEQQEQAEWEYICAVTKQRMSGSKTPVVIRPPEIARCFKGVK